MVCYGYLPEYILWCLGLTLLLALLLGGMTAFACHRLCDAFSRRTRVLLSAVYVLVLPIGMAFAVLAGLPASADDPVAVREAVSSSLLLATGVVLLPELILTAVSLWGYAKPMVLTRLTDGILVLLFPLLTWQLRWLPLIPYPRAQTHPHAAYDFIAPLLLLYLFLFIKAAILNKTVDDYPVGRAYVKWIFLILLAVNAVMRFWYHPHLYYDCVDLVTHRGLLVILAVNAVVVTVLLLLNFIGAGRKLMPVEIDGSRFYWVIYVGITLLAVLFVYLLVEYTRRGGY